MQQVECEDRDDGNESIKSESSESCVCVSRIAGRGSISCAIGKDESMGDAHDARPRSVPERHVFLKSCRVSVDLGSGHEDWDRVKELQLEWEDVAFRSFRIESTARQSRAEHFSSSFRFSHQAM